MPSQSALCFGIFPICVSGHDGMSVPVQIFLPGRLAAAQVALGFVLVKDLFDKMIKPGVDMRKPFRNILMYSAFADGKMLCGGAHGRAVLH